MADQQLNEKQLQALLRVKRYEQPPPDYFNGLLHAIHRRQREEMLRRPAWRIFFERIGAFFASLRKDWSLVGSAACIVMIGVGVIQMVLPRRVPVHSTPIVAHAPIQPFIYATEPEDHDVITANQLVFTNQDPGNTRFREVKSPYPKQRKSVTFPVHYVFDTQPSNHEPPTQVHF
jgi:hypothetical protein